MHTLQVCWCDVNQGTQLWAWHSCGSVQAQISPSKLFSILFSLWRVGNLYCQPIAKPFSAMCHLFLSIEFVQPPCSTVWNKYTVQRQYCLYTFSLPCTIKWSQGELRECWRRMGKSSTHKKICGKCKNHCKYTIYGFLQCCFLFRISERSLES